MPRKGLLPPELLSGPFSLADAAGAGLARWHLEGRNWRRLGHGTYAWVELEDDPIQALKAARLRLPPGSAFSGLTAAWLHGVDVVPCRPVEVTVPAASRISSRSGMAVRRSTLDARDVVQLRCLPATSIVRTVAEICSRLPLIEAVAVADAALHGRHVQLHELVEWARSHHGHRGVKSLRRALDHVEPASESPMESRLRMVLVLGGLPRPKSQQAIHDRDGRFAGRSDLFYEHQRLAIEYDGAVHRDSLVADDRRQNRLLRAGVRLLRFTAADVLRHPDAVVAQVRSALSSA